MMTRILRIALDGHWNAGRVLLVALPAAVGGWIPPALADPLNPLDFPSLGRVTLVRGVYSIDTSGATPKLTGPGTDLSGTVCASGIAVFRFDDLIVHNGAVLTAAGGVDEKATHPVALLASGDLTFAGTFDARGASGADGTRIGSGIGGGGTFGGGSGTRGVTSKPGGVGGVFNGAQPHVRLSGGGGGVGGLTAGVRGGGGGGAGGGAVELGALGALTLTGGTINVNGGDGGNGGHHGLEEGGSGLAAGGGGGSGGAVLLHGQTVTLGGAISARGGKGGLGRGNGDGGGAGRVAIQATANPGTAGITAEGGDPRDPSKADVITFVQPILMAGSVDLGPVPVGSKVTAVVTIRNAGTEGSCINGQFPAVSAPFARVGAGVFSGLSPGASITCEYTFAPAGLGSFTQSLEYLSNAGPAGVTISGTGVAPQDRAGASPKP